MKKFTKLAVIGGLLAAGVLGTQMYLNHTAEKKVAEFFESSDMDEVKFQSASFDLFSRSLVIKNIQMPENENIEGSIEKLVLHKWDDKHEKPRFLDVEMRGIVIDPTPMVKQNPELAEVLEMKRTEGDFRISYEIDEKDKTLTLNRLSADFKDFFALEGSFEVGNWSEDAMTEDKAMYDLTLKHLNLRMEDRNLVNRLFTLSQAFGQTMTREQWADEIDRTREFFAQSPEAENVPAEFMQASAEVVKFLRKPGVLAIQATPDSPIALNDIEKIAPLDLAKQLKLSVSYSEI